MRVWRRGCGLNGEEGVGGGLFGTWLGLGEDSGALSEGFILGEI